MKKSTLKMIVISAVPFVLIGFFVILFMQTGGQFYRYHAFKADLAASIAHAIDNNSLRADYEGTSVRIHPDNANEIYERVTAGGFSMDEFTIPAEDGIWLDFGDGAQLWLWPGQPHGTVVRFQAADGSCCEWLAGKESRFITLEKLVSLSGMNEANEPWK